MWEVSITIYSFKFFVSVVFDFRKKKQPKQHMDQDSAREQLRQRRLRLQRQRQKERTHITPTKRSNAGSKSSEDQFELIVPKMPSSLSKRNSNSNNNNNNNNDDNNDVDETSSHYEAKYSPSRETEIRRSWNKQTAVEQKSQAPSPSEDTMWRTDVSSKVEENSIASTKKEEDAEIVDVEQRAEEEEEDEEEDVPYMDGQLDDLDVSGVCDTPITDRENQDMLTEHDQDVNEMASDDGSDTDTEHDIEHSPSAHMYGLRRQDLERHQLQNENSSITNNTTNTTNNTTTTTTHTTTKQQDPLASLFELLETTDAQSIAASSVHRGSNHFQTMLQPSPATGQHHLDWEDTISVVSSLAPSLAAPSMMSVASSRMTTASMAGSSSGHHHQKVYDNMKARLTGLTMEVDDKSKTLSMLKKLLREARAAHRETEEKLASREAKKLKIVRSEYESTIARHLSFIDRLLADKQSLSDKCDALTQEMSRVEKRYALRVHDVQSQHVIELKRQKELLAAGERARKERWTNEKRKEIKETTLKGLEPELQRILTKHKKELQCMEDGHLKNIRKLEIQIQKEKDDSIRSIVEQMKRERDEAVSAEVDIGRAKLRTQMKHYDDELLNYKNKYENDTSNRVNRNENEITKMSDKHMIEMEQIKRDEMERREDLARRYNEERASIERRHEDTILDIRRRTEDERNEWKKNEKIKFVEIKKNEINDIQKELTIERDEQIDLVIRRLDEETGRNQRESSNTFTTRLEEMKKEHELDLRGVRASESKYQQKKNKIN